MAGGNLIQFEEDSDLRGVSNGCVHHIGKRLSCDDFKSEKELCQYIEANISEFCRDSFDDVYVSHEIDKPIVPQQRFGPRTRRVDMIIRCKKHKYIIELKNPTHPAENRHGIGQLLDYGREFIDTGKKLVLISTSFDINTAKTIEHYNLPIVYMYINKTQILEFKETA